MGEYIFYDIYFFHFSPQLDSCFLLILTAPAKKSRISTFTLSLFFQKKRAQLLTLKTKAKKNPQSKRESTDASDNSRTRYEIFRTGLKYPLLTWLLLNDTVVGNGYEATCF